MRALGQTEDGETWKVALEGGAGGGAGPPGGSPRAAGGAVSPGGPGPGDGRS